MMKHYGGVGLASSLPFIHSPRQPRTWFFHRIYRFAKGSPPQMPGDRWHCTGVDSDALNLIVSKPVMLHGVQHFGSEGGKYTVSLEVKNVRNGFSLVKQTGTYSSEKDETNIYIFIMDLMSCLTTRFVLSRTKSMRSSLSSRAHHLGM